MIWTFNVSAFLGSEWGFVVYRRCLSHWPFRRFSLYFKRPHFSNLLDICTTISPLQYLSTVVGRLYCCCGWYHGLCSRSWPLGGRRHRAKWGDQTIRLYPFFYYNLLDNIFAELIVYKVGFLSIFAVEWFVFTYTSIMVSSLIQKPFFFFQRRRATRIALALAFARIFPPGEKTRNYAISLAILFLFLFIAILIQTLLFCTDEKAWISSSFLQCDFHGELLYFLISGKWYTFFLPGILFVYSPITFLFL